jgi:hypothetical protein
MQRIGDKNLQHASVQVKEHLDTPVSVIKKRTYESYQQTLHSSEETGPFDDPLDIHVHRYQNSVCMVCNHKQAQYHPKQTNSLPGLRAGIHELDKKYVGEYMRLLNVKSVM